MHGSPLIDTCSRLVEGAVSRGFDEVAILATRTDRTMVKLANSQPSVTQRWRGISLSMYLVKEKRIFILEYRPAGGDVSEKEFDTILEHATVVQESPFYAPLPEPKPVEKIEGVVDKRVLEYIRDPVELAELSIEAAHRERIDYVAGTIDLWYTEKALATSKGVALEEGLTGLQVYLRAFSEPDGSGQWSTCSTSIDIREIEKTSITASRYAAESKGRRSVEPGRYDVVLSPLVFGNILNLVARMSSAFNVFTGLSIFMKNKPGDQVASERLTLIDAPRDRELPGATSFDDEGVPTYNKPIIDKGVLRTLLHNSKTASKLGVNTTGNAGWISPRPWNLVVEPGSYSIDELIREVKRGLLITNNWYTRLQNYVEGAFSTITRDALFLIENGEIARPVEKVRIADRLPSFLKNIEALGREAHRIMWWEVRIPSKLPYVLVRDVGISKHML